MLWKIGNSDDDIIALQKANLSAKYSLIVFSIRKQFLKYLSPTFRYCLGTCETEQTVVSS